MRILGAELEILRRTPWSRIREQDSVYKEFLQIVGNGKPMGSVWKETIAVSATMRISVEKLHHQIRLRILSCGRMSENHRGPEVPEVRAPAVELPFAWTEVRHGSVGGGVGYCFDMSVCAEVSKMIRTELRHCKYVDVVLSWVCFHEGRRFSRQPLARQMLHPEYRRVGAGVVFSATCATTPLSWSAVQVGDATDGYHQGHANNERYEEFGRGEQKTSSWRKLAEWFFADWAESECLVARTWK